MNRDGRFLRLLFCLASTALTGCPDDASPGGTDAAPADVASDDVAADAPGDVATGTDASPDARPDVAADAAADASVDRAPPDASVDAALDASVDASPDASVDAAPDTNAPDDAAPTCPEGQRQCVCATGFYCLRIGASCLVPTAPCPG